MKIPEIRSSHWFNDHLNPEDLRGKIVLVDFWTYSCVNCQRTIPYIREWWKKYKDFGLVIIGVHSPEFEFEKNTKDLKKVLSDLEISWPTVQDNDHSIWRDYGASFWPTKYIANASGEVVYEHHGEGNYGATEMALREALKELNSDQEIDLGDPIFTDNSIGNVCLKPTPELYCGYSRGNIANWSGYKYDTLYNYLSPDTIPDDKLALSGPFIAREEFVETSNENAQLLLNFQATEVNLVIKPTKGKCEIRLETFAEIIDKKKSLLNQQFVTVTRPTLYNLIEKKDALKGTLSVAAHRGNFQAYAFSFSGCL